MEMISVVQDIQNFVTILIKKPIEFHPLEVYITHATLQLSLCFTVVENHRICVREKCKHPGEATTFNIFNFGYSI